MTGAFAILLVGLRQARVAEILRHDRELVAAEAHRQGNPFEVAVVGCYPDRAGLKGTFDGPHILTDDLAILRVILHPETGAPELVDHRLGEGAIGIAREPADFRRVFLVAEDQREILDRGMVAAAIELKGEAAEELEQDGLG